MSLLKTDYVFGLDIRRQENQFFLILLIATFTITITTGISGLKNSKIVFIHELVLIGAYFLAVRQVSPIVRMIKAHPIMTVLVLLWVASITLSLYFSPLGLRHISIARARYYETITHVTYFAVLLCYFTNCDVPLRKLYSVILMSYALIVVHAFFTWHFSPEPHIHDRNTWFSFFPFAGHARHAGYNMIVAVIAGIFLVADRTLTSVQRTWTWIGLVLVLSCLIWLGGRGAMLSVVLALMLILWWVRREFCIDIRSSTFLGLALLVSLVISHQLSIFDFNGLWNSISRSVEESESVNSLSSGRIYIWTKSLEAIRNDWLLGLGSQGYLFMPEKPLPQTIMPHNMVIQFLVEWGIIGTILFLTLLARVFCLGFSVLRRTAKNSPMLVSSVALVVALTLHGLTDGTYYHGKPGFYLAVCFAIWLGTTIKNQKKHEI